MFARSVALASLRWDRRSRMMKGAQLGSSTAAEDEDENAPSTDDSCGPIARVPHGRDGSDCVVTQLEFFSLGDWPCDHRHVNNLSHGTRFYKRELQISVEGEKG